MDLSQYHRDKKAVLSAIIIKKDDGMLIAKKPISVLAPTHWFDGQLGSIDGDRYVVTGILAWICGDAMTTSRIHAKIPFTPDSINSIKIGDDNYMLLSWEAGGIICPNTNLAMDRTLSFDIYNEIVAKGKQPPWMTYLDRAELFYDAPKFAGVDLGGTQALQSIFCSACIRTNEDRTMQLREILKSQDDYNTTPYTVIPLKSVDYGANNATSRLVGAYARIGIASELVNPTENVEPVETLLRS